MKKILFVFRKLLWRILGMKYQKVLRDHDFVYLKDDIFTEIGESTYENGAKVWRWSNAPVTIGKYCSIAYDVNFIVDQTFHRTSPVTSFPLFNGASKLTSREMINDDLGEFIPHKIGIEVGNDVWIGMGAFILPGVRIGNGVTIAANSVVNKDVPNYAVVAGVPAKLVKYKACESLVYKLNEIGWWNWDKNILLERREDFKLSIEDFVLKYDFSSKNDH